MTVESKKPGSVVVASVPKNGGRRMNFGTMRLISGQMMVCIGYTEGGDQVVFAPITQLKHIRGSVRSAEHKLTYRLLKWAVRKYEIKLVN